MDRCKPLANGSEAAVYYVPEVLKAAGVSAGAYTRPLFGST